MSHNRITKKVDGRDRFFICDVCQGRYLISQSTYVSDSNSQQYGMLLCPKDVDEVDDLRTRKVVRDLVPPDPKLVRIEQTNYFQTLDQDSMIETGGQQVSVGYAPDAPTNFYLIEVEPGAVSFGWEIASVGSSSIIGYRIERAFYNSDEFEDFEVLSVNTQDPDTTYIDVNTSASTQYIYRLKAINTYGSSDYSNEFTITLNSEGDYLMAHYVRAGGSNTTIYKQATAPTASDSVLVGDLWIDTTTSTTKVATSITPVTWALSQNGSTDLALTTPKVTTGIKDVNGNLEIGFTATASAVNYVNITNGATTGGPGITAAGTATSMPLFVSAKSNAAVTLLGVNTNAVRFMNSSDGNQYVSHDISAVTAARTVAWPNVTGSVNVKSLTSTATAAGTTTLTASSATIQQFTGATTQTCVLPVASTLPVGYEFKIINDSSGAVTVQSSGANTLQAMAANSQLVATLVTASGTGTASWTWTYQLKV